MFAKLSQNLMIEVKRGFYEQDKKIYQSLSIKQKSVRLKAKKLLYESAYNNAEDAGNTDWGHNYAHEH